MENKEILKRLGDNIVKLRKEQNMNSVELGYKAGIEKSNLFKIEHGRTNISFLTLYKISQGLNVPMSKIVDFE